MRAAVYSQRGDSSVLSVIDVPDPQPGAGEVRVRVHVSGVNPTDWRSRIAGPDLGETLQIPNQDGAGVIDSVGAGVDPGRIGERVWVFHAAWQRLNGTAATYTVLPAAQAVALPDSIDFDQAAGLGIPYITAYGCLYSDGPIANRTILVAGGAGAVGHAAIELAILGGARVISTVSSDDKARLAADAGAHAVVNYRDPKAADHIREIAPAGVDRIIEVALTTNLDLDLAVLAPHGTVVTYAVDSAGEPTLNIRSLMMPNFTLRFALVYNFTDDMIAAAVAAISSALAAGELTPLPTIRYSLDEIAAAHDAVQGNAVGKVLVDIP